MCPLYKIEKDQTRYKKLNQPHPILNHRYAVELKKHRSSDEKFRHPENINNSRSWGKTPGLATLGIGWWANAIVAQVLGIVRHCLRHLGLAFLIEKTCKIPASSKQSLVAGNQVFTKHASVCFYCEVFRVLLGLLIPRTSPGEKQVWK